MSNIKIPIQILDCNNNDLLIKYCELSGYQDHEKALHHLLELGFHELANNQIESSKKSNSICDSASPATTEKNLTKEKE